MAEHEGPWPAGTPCWMDLGAPDPGKAAGEYAALFGWDDVEAEPEFGYRIVTLRGLRVAGIGSPPPAEDGGPPAPATWTTFLATDDVDQTCAAVTAAGGTVFFPPMDIGPHGRMTIAQDPTGAAFGLWQSGDNTGCQLANEPGAFVWNECMTRDFEAARAFYTTVFGYEVSDMSSDGFTYASLLLGGQPVGGLGQLPPEAPAEVPAHWMAYFMAEDCDAAVAKVVSLGGQVAREPWDTPFGRMATVVDSQGAAFSLMSASAS
jgi:uncharacterized protein